MGTTSCLYLQRVMFPAVLMWALVIPLCVTSVTCNVSCEIWQPCGKAAIRQASLLQVDVVRTKVHSKSSEVSAAADLSSKGKELPNFGKLGECVGKSAKCALESDPSADKCKRWKALIRCMEEEESSSSFSSPEDCTSESRKNYKDQCCGSTSDSSSSFGLCGFVR